MRDPIQFLVPGLGGNGPIAGIPPLGPLSDEWLTKLAKIRGALFTVEGPPDTPNGGPNHRISTDYLSLEDPHWRQVARDLYIQRGYTHGPMGPFVDPGYHGQNPAVDFRLDKGEAAVTMLEELWQAGIIPVCFMAPDNWTVEDMRPLEKIFRSDRWQRVCRIVVPGWEPSKDRSNDEWVAWFEWLWDVFPHSLKYIHLCADFDAPGNNDDLTPGRKGFKGNDGCWRRLAPLLHGYLNQSARFEKPDFIDSDPRNGGRTNFQGWADDFDPEHTGGLHNRFVHGYAGWPTNSAWQRFGRPDHIHLIAAEYASFWCYWQGRSENEAQTWGDMALKRGAIGVLDGFHK